MGTKVGLWIDHKKAIIVAITDNEEEMALVISNVDKQPRRYGGSPHKPPYESLHVRGDDILQRAFTGHLNVYYDAVIACIGDAESILIFGPGEAKGELKKRLERDKRGGRIAGVETVDKMTNRQVAARVRGHFATKPPRTGSRRGHPTRSSDRSGRPRRKGAGSANDQE